jgi:hypothetical protein
MTSTTSTPALPASPATATTTTTRPRARAGRVLASALLGGAVAGALNLAVYAVARLAGVPFVGQFDPSGPAGPLPVPLVLVSSLVPAIAAGLFYLALRAITARANAAFVALAAIFTLVSFIPPLGIAGASLGTKLALEVMHVVAAIAITGSIVRRNR